MKITKEFLKILYTKILYNWLWVQISQVSLFSLNVLIKLRQLLNNKENGLPMILYVYLDYKFII